jgi:aspartate aminotransferase
MFENLKPTKTDPILGLMAAFRNDPRKEKIDLGVGVYMDDSGHTPVMTAVKSAEARLFDEERTKSYQAIPGDSLYNECMMKLLLGDTHEILKTRRISTLQAPGGSGALRVGAEVILRAKTDATIWIGTPSWPNHIPLLGGAGLSIQQYPYYDTNLREIRFDEMMETLKQVPRGDVVLLHGCCHNPTGADLEPSHWDEIAELALSKGFIPFIDIAYQGLGKGLEADAYGLRTMAASLPELIIASSCSKNFGLYRERTGSISFISDSSHQAEIVLSQAKSVARQMYSMPPAHGALLVAMILDNETLRIQWQNELEQVRCRIISMRSVLVDRIKNNSAGINFDHIERQSGMFSFLGISAEQLERLRKDYGIYIVSSTRINLAGINSNNINYLSESIKSVLS